MAIFSALTSNTKIIHGDDQLTNTIKEYHRQIRKITKFKGAFTSGNALLKLAYLTIQNMSKIWNKTTFTWKTMLSELLITFESSRFKLAEFEG